MSEEERMRHNVIIKQIALQTHVRYKDYAINERNALLELKHDNIVLLLDNFKCYPVKHVMILESLDIELFDHIILKNRCSETVIANLTGQVLMGLQYIHDKNWAHLDIQPSNIMIKGTSADIPPIVKIIDFAYAKRLDTGMPLISRYGQPEFVAPEQVTEKPISNKTDIFSMGIMLYLILSGVSPFYVPDSDRKTLDAIRNCAWVFEVRAFREISKESKDLISCLLKKNPEERLSAKQALRHEWFNVAPTKICIKTERLRYFQSRKKWSAKISGLGRPMDIRPLKDILLAVGGYQSYTVQNKNKKPAKISESSSEDDENSVHIHSRNQIRNKRQKYSNRSGNESETTIESSDYDIYENDIWEPPLYPGSARTKLKPNPSIMTARAQPQQKDSYNSTVPNARLISNSSSLKEQQQERETIINQKKMIMMQTSSQNQMSVSLHTNSQGKPIPLIKTPSMDHPMPADRVATSGQNNHNNNNYPSHRHTIGNSMTQSSSRPPVSNVTRYGAGNRMFQKPIENDPIALGRSKVENWGNTTSSFTGGYSAPVSEVSNSSGKGFNLIATHVSDTGEIGPHNNSRGRDMNTNHDNLQKVRQQNFMSGSKKQVSFEKESDQGLLSDTESSLTSASQLQARRELKNLNLQQEKNRSFDNQSHSINYRNSTDKDSRQGSNFSAGQHFQQPVARSISHDNHLSQFQQNNNQQDRVQFNLPKYSDEIVDDFSPPILTQKPPKPPKGKLSSFYFKAKSALNINKSQKDHSHKSNKKMSLMRNTGSMKKSSSQGFITDQNFSNSRDFDDQRFINSNSNGPMNFTQNPSQQGQSNFLGSSIRNREQSGGSIQVSRSPRVGSRRFFSEERGFGSQQRLNGPIRSILKKNASGTGFDL